MKNATPKALKVLVINLESAVDRFQTISKHLSSLEIDYEIVLATRPSEFTLQEDYGITSTAVAVWQSHVACFKIISDSNIPHLVLEDDAELRVSKEEILEFCRDMEENELDMIQIGFLSLNIIDRTSIITRNIYNWFIRNSLFARVFESIGFKEVSRAKEQNWRLRLPAKYIVNDIKYGAHAYLISPKLSRVFLKLNSPTFLSTDDFFVSLSKMKSFRLARLKTSLVKQNGSTSSFVKRFGTDE